MNFKTRNFNPNLDRAVILDYNTRVNFECASEWIKESGYEVYKAQ